MSGIGLRIFVRSQVDSDMTTTYPTNPKLRAMFVMIRANSEVSRENVLYIALLTYQCKQSSNEYNQLNSMQAQLPQMDADGVQPNNAPRLK